MTLGKRIYELRTVHRLSQEELAEKLGVSRQSVSKWETDAAVPDLDKLIKLCDVFAVSLDALVGRETTKVSPRTERRQPSIHQTIIGYILLAVSLVGALLGVILGGEEEGVILCELIAATVFGCSLVCLNAKTHAGYWCAWIAFAPLVILTPFTIGLAVYYQRALFQLVWYALMALAARKRFAGMTIIADRKKTTYIILGWIAVVGISVFSGFAVNALLTHLTLSLTAYGGVALLLTYTVAYGMRKR